MPLGLVFRKCVLWHEGREYVLRNLQETAREPGALQWNFRCRGKNGLQLEVAIDGCGSSLHRLPYLKTDCSGTFDVLNNSLASATVRLQHPNRHVEELQTPLGAVLEFTGDCG